MSLQLPTTRTLYDYQLQGAQFLYDTGFGFLWDDPGLGKTTQAIVAARSLGGRWLIICPNSLKRWWRREIINLYPEDAKSIVVATVGGRLFDPKSGRRTEIHAHIYEKRYELPRWVIVHYAGLRIAEQSYKQINWAGVICDEAHYIKNKDARRTQAVMEVTPDTACRIGLTATPFGTITADLWSQLRWMAPTLPGLRSYWRFYNIFVNYEWEKRVDKQGREFKYRKVSGGKNLDLLSQVMHAYGLKRTKKEVAPQLPPVITSDVPLELSGRQEVIYEALTDKNRVELVVRNTAENSDRPEMSGTVIKNTLARLTKTEQWLSHPWTFDPGVKGAKLEWLLEWAKEYPFPAVIATRFRASAERIYRELGERCGRPIMGKLPEKIREVVADEWRNGKTQFLVGTIATIGVGLNLQHAHAMICYDQLSSAIQMEQLYQRIHRIDTDHPVEAVYLYIEREEGKPTTNEVVLRSFREKWTQKELVEAYLQILQMKGELP